MGWVVVIKKLPHPYKLTHKITSKKREEAFCGGFPIEGENNFFRISRAIFLDFFHYFSISFPIFLYFLPMFFSKMKGYYRGMWEMGGS